MPFSLKDLVQEALKTVPEISPDRLRDELSGPRDFLLIDVREPDEFAAGRLPGAIPIPRGWIEVKADLEHHKRDPQLADRNRRLVLYCGGGNRSALAARALQLMGFTRVESLAEGWTGWTQRGHPVER